MKDIVPQKVKAVRWHGIEDLRLDTIDVPELRDDYVLVKNLYTGICGTDRHTLHHATFVDNSQSSLNYPAILGHESSGVVVELGKKIETDLVGQPIRPGDMIIYFEVFSCGNCLYCKQGDMNICRNYLGAAMKPGTMVEYFTYPRVQIIKADGIDARQAAAVEPSACALHSTRLADPKIGDTVVIIGGGCIGLLRLQLVKDLGATKIILIEPIKARREIAVGLGADIVLDPLKDEINKIIADETFEGYGADVVFEDVGSAKTQELAVTLARPHGTVMISGISPEPVKLNFFDHVQLRELKLLGSIGTAGLVDRRNDYLVVVDLIRSERLKIDPIITHEFTLEEYRRAFEISEDSSQSIKVMIKVN